MSMADVISLSNLFIQKSIADIENNSILMSFYPAIEELLNSLSF